MAIPPEEVARVRDATDFVAVASEHMALKRVGRRWVGLCPFHQERSPSFSVNAEEGLYYCFGCGAGGDVITFVREVEHLEFADAVARLAGRAGITIRATDGRPSADVERRRSLLEVMARAVDWYHQRLVSAPDAAGARAYLRGRGYGAEVVRQFRLGWAPEGWDELVRALSLGTRVAADCGLGFVNSRGRLQDSFRGRVLFPIFDVRGEPVALGGRILPGGRGPKYKNSAENLLYKKSKTLYGLNWAKGAIVSAAEVVVCEGYTDVIGFHLAGVSQAVATCGTALGEDHVRALAHFAPRLVLAYDADAAGRSASERIYAWEKELAVDVAVADLAPGTDPADTARDDPAALRRAVSEARPFLAFRLTRVLEAADLTTVEGRARAAEAAVAVVGEHPSDLVRDQYLMEVADRTKVDVVRLRSRLEGRAQGQGSAPSRGSRQAEGASVTRLPGPEEAVLRVAVNRPEALAGMLTDNLFAPGLGRRCFAVLAGADTLGAALDGADDEVAAVLRRLAVEDDTDEAHDVVGRLAEQAAWRELAALEARSRSESEPMALVPLMGWLRGVVASLQQRDPAATLATVEALVRWLAGEPGNGSGRGSEELR